MAHEYKATVAWKRAEGEAFTDLKFSRGHEWSFDGGVEVPASASPHVVPLPLSVEAAVDPEEAFVASLSSCHMLWFLAIAAKRGYRVDEYDDEPDGVLESDADGRVSMTRVALRPRIRFGGDPVPAPSDVAAMHDEAHHACYIANSVKTAIVVEPR